MEEMTRRVPRSIWMKAGVLQVRPAMYGCVAQLPAIVFPSVKARILVHPVVPVMRRLAFVVRSIGPEPHDPGVEKTEGEKVVMGEIDGANEGLNEGDDVGVDV